MRDEFLAWLVRLVADGVITEDEAATMLAEFDRGEREWDAPLPLPLAIGGYDNSNDDAALALLLMVLGKRLHFPSVTASHANLHLINGVQGAFEREAYRLAAELTSGRLTLSQWQSAMLRNLHAGYGATLALSARSRGVGGVSTHGAVLTTQSAYLSRFADVLALQTPSTAAIGSRSALYGNSLRSLYYTEQEKEFASSGAMADGWVVIWRSQDDRHTCPLCIDRDETVYLPGTAHPVPGQPGLCFGRCRCWLEYVYDPARWRALRDGGGGRLAVRLRRR